MFSAHSDIDPLPESAKVETPIDASKSRPTKGCHRIIHKSKRNAFGIVRAYRILRGSSITHDPDQAVTLWDLTDSRRNPAGPSSQRAVAKLSEVDPSESSAKKVSDSSKRSWGPFPNKSSFSLADWYWQSKNKSFSDFQKLIAIFKQPDFSPVELVDVNWKASFRALGANREDLEDHEGDWIQDDGWKSTPITIDVPFHNRMLNPGFDAYMAGHFRHRSLVSVIKEKISNSKDSRSFHYQPYKATWKPTPRSPEVELYGELYASRAFREAHEEIQALSNTAINQDIERVVVAMMFWSDGTQLTSFGGASLWPCYLFFGNESKYRRSQPSERLGEQVAYFIKVLVLSFRLLVFLLSRYSPISRAQLSDTFNDYLRKRNNGKLPTDAVYAHCARELFQQQWSIMLDDELLDAMKHGLVLLCPDGKERCFYPRIFTYSADYPEKYVLIHSQPSVQTMY